MQQAIAELKSRLQRKPLALTAVSARDPEGLETVARALRQGRDELFKWGVGPELQRGDLVGLYIPKTVPAQPGPFRRIRGGVTNLYSVARPTTEQAEFPWKQVVWLEGRVSLPSQVTVQALRKSLLAPSRNVPRYLQNLGLEERPLEQDEVERFWQHVLRQNASHADLIRQRLLPSSLTRGYDYDVGLSYASESLREAQQIAQECTNHGVHAFFNETVMSGLPAADQEWMEANLEAVYGTEAFLNVALWSSAYARGRWTRFEFDIMKRASAGRGATALVVKMPGSRGPRNQRPSDMLEWTVHGAYGVVREILRRLLNAVPRPEPRKPSD